MKSFFMAFALFLSVPAFAEEGPKKDQPADIDSVKGTVGKEDKDLAKQKNQEGLALLRQKKFFEASELFNEAIDLNPDNANYHNNLGLAYLRDGDPYSAQAEFETAIQLGLDKPNVWNNLGMAYEHMNYIKEAKKAYLKAAEQGNEAAERNYQRIKNVKTLRGKELGC